MKILFADSISEDRLDPLRADGHELVVEPSLGSDELPAHMAGVDILVVRSTSVSATTIDAADRLGLIVRAGAGTDTIDKQAASDEGVYVCNVPGRNAVAVAELTFALLLAVDRGIASGVRDLRAGTWNKGLYSKADGILGKTLAIVGLGEIGLAVAARARAFGMTVTAIRKDDRPASVQARIRSIGIRLVNTEQELLSEADVVSLHVPKSAGTVGMVNADFLSQLPDRAILLNTSRGEVVDEAALLDAINTKGLRAGLDVWPSEPSGGSGEFQSALAVHDQVVGSHHIGASTTQAQESVADGTIEVIEAYLEGRIINCVNVDPDATGTTRLTIRHHDRVGVLAQVLAVLRSSGLNIQQMQNQIFTGGGAAVATINVDGEVSTETLERLIGIDDVLAADQRHQESELNQP